MSQAMMLAPLRPLEVLLSHLAQFGIQKPVCKFLRKEAIFQEVEFQYQAIASGRDIAETTENIPILIKALARLFENPPNGVKVALEDSLEPLDIGECMLVLIKIASNNFSTGSDKKSKVTYHLRKGNQGLLHKSIPGSNHSGPRNFVCYSQPRRDPSNENYP
jgi:hypothetical protein